MITPEQLKNGMPATLEEIQKTDSIYPHIGSDFLYFGQRLSSMQNLNEEGRANLCVEFENLQVKRIICSPSISVNFETAFIQKCREKLLTVKPYEASSIVFYDK